MSWPSYDSRSGAWGDPGRYKPSDKNLEAARAVAAYNDILAIPDQPGGLAMIGIDGRLRIDHHPVIFFGFYFNPNSGGIISGITSEGNNVRGYLPSGYAFEQVTKASYLLKLPGEDEIKSTVMVSPAATGLVTVTPQIHLLNSQAVRIRLISHAVGATGRRAIEALPAESYVGVCGWASRTYCQN